MGPRHDDGREGDPPSAGSNPGEIAPASPGRAGRPMLRFVLSFLGAALLLFGLYWVSEAAHGFRYVNRANAIACSALLHVFGMPHSRDGTVMYMRGGSMDIISECSAIYVLILFTAGVLAYPTTWRVRLRGIALGLPTIVVVNLLRLVTLGAVLQFHAAWLPLFHEYLWQVFFILVVAFLYLIWIERLVPRARLVEAA